jgi:hypothetical protein
MDGILRHLSGIRPLTQPERAALDDFCRAMREEVVPQIAEDVLEREVLAVESRARVLGLLGTGRNKGRDTHAVPVVQPIFPVAAERTLKVVGPSDGAAASSYPELASPGAAPLT